MGSKAKNKSKNSVILKIRELVYPSMYKNTKALRFARVLGWTLSIAVVWFYGLGISIFLIYFGVIQRVVAYILYGVETWQIGLFNKAWKNLLLCIILVIFFVAPIILAIKDPLYYFTINKSHPIGPSYGTGADIDLMIRAIGY